ncbi:MAG: methyltransferase, TIGR04325 family [Betaproteobacteria bacterium]|nr:methyltransferase, TIGR04325 family [Betaproteobacteria bacterium]
MNIKNLARKWCPPILLMWARQVREHQGIVFTGNYPSWSEARQASTGYDSATIFHRVRDAALKVKSGAAVFERDSACFYQEEYRWPTLACLLAIAAERRSHLRVLDLGGSLGSYYFQHRKFMSRLEKVHWSVVEQKHFVACGRDEFQNECLKFYESVDDCLAEGPVDVAFLSSVLQYLERPYAMLATLADAEIPYLLIDRTAFVEGTQDRLTVQHVPESIYEASYPAWLFSRQKFMTAIAKASYRPITEFLSDDDFGIGQFQGIFLERI